MQQHPEWLTKYQKSFSNFDFLDNIKYKIQSRHLKNLQMHQQHYSWFLQ